jgi:cell division protein FtsI/penicillin-binding protein 2
VDDDLEAAERARPPEPGFGLRHATQFSLNAWYAGVALMMEQPRIDEYATRVGTQSGARIPAPELMLTRTSRWIGIDDQQRLDLAINLPESAGLKRHSGRAHDVLFPQLARSTLAAMAFNQDDWGARELMMYTTALNGIGQTISASPLQMALPAAAIATGQRVRPYLFAAWGGESLVPPEPTPLPVDTELLEILRSGMKAVTEVGTAARAFPRPLACRVYGKTGTAEIDAARSYNSGWFIGWREPAAPGQRRLAFACMTTHATGSYRFGGTACAPVVSRVLQRLESAAGGAG